MDRDSEKRLEIREQLIELQTAVMQGRVSADRVG
jgi:hypothetical protein